MTERKPISFGDNVRVRDTPATRALGLAGLTGNVYGETTPSVTKVDVIGELKEDYALNVHFDGLGKGFWFTPDQLEFADHAPGSEVTLEGVDRKWVRTQSGEWEEIPGGAKYRSLWERWTGCVFRKKRQRSSRKPHRG